MELWDLYNERRELLQQDHVRGQALPPGTYHLVVHIWIQNSNGQFLMSQRAADRAHDALKWECTGGSVLKGENSYAGAIREVREELGIDLSAVAGELVFSEVRERMHGVRFCGYFGCIPLSLQQGGGFAPCRVPGSRSDEMDDHRADPRPL